MMQTDWQISLSAQGAAINNGEATHFGNAAKELIATTNSHTLCDLSHLGLLQLSGEDAVSFLQGQVSNDVDTLTGNNAHYSAYCNPKGRMLALFLAFSSNEKIHLQLNQSLLSSVAKRLKMYVMRSKVEVKDPSENIIKFGINGPTSEQLLLSIFTSLPSQDYGLATNDNGVILKLPTIDNHTRFEIITDTASAIKVWDTLKEKCTPVGKPCWDWLDIQAGIPDVSINTQEQFVPQMLNLDILDGINFKKGCYTGQEIIARMHYLGSVKRRTYLAKTNAAITIEAGDKVKNSAQSEVGQIVRVAPNLEGGFDVLAEMRIEAAGSDVTVNDSPLTLGTLPYSLEKTD